MQPVASSTAPEPFPYGWRYVQRPLPDGTVEIDQVPLTLEDVLHPQQGDVIPESRVHEMDCRYLADVFATRPLGPAHVSVTADLLIDWGVGGVRPVSPDVGVFVGLEEEPNLREGTFHVAESGGCCLLVVEVVSPHTRSNDIERKVKLYHQVGVPLYVIIDQEREDGPRRLIAYRWQTKEYERVALDERGRLLLEPLGLYLSVHDDRVVCQDVATGRELGDYARLAWELEEADRRDQEREREMEKVIQRAHDAEAKLRAEEKAREDAEAKARDAERELNALRERLRQLQAGGTEGS